jgi:DNA-binding NarL/FixJ family response regulator
MSKNAINFYTDVSVPNVFKDFKDCNLTSATSWNELASLLSTDPKCIVFHVDMISKKEASISEFLNMLETFIRFNVSDKKPHIAVVINGDTTLSTVKELQKDKILGIIPDSKSWPANEIKDAMNYILAGKSYWPKHIISKLPGNKDRQQKEIHLTDRQLQVYELIASRGLSNKQIAKTLKISESTVKIHVSAILKNLCVRNRTQLALTKL